jgi:uncharacterized membrane protein YvbJ
MRCSKCGTEALVGKRFCTKCGGPLPIHCPKCGADNPANAKFCADCGSSLGGIAAPSSDASAIVFLTAKEASITHELPDGVRAAKGERKTVTALFADKRID